MKIKSTSSYKLKRLLLIVLAVALVWSAWAVFRFNAADSAHFLNRPPEWQGLGSHKVEGGVSHALKWSALLEKHHQNDWDVAITFTFLTNLGRGTWVLPTTPFNARLSLWDTNGDVLSERVAARRAMNLPDQTTVAESMRVVSLERRGYKLPFGRVNDYEDLAQFRLSSAFDLPVNRDIILEIKPLLYASLPNQTNIGLSAKKVQLVEFPAFCVKLKADGNVVKLK